ncbi:MAG: hypothetical protein ACUVWR_08375 [Anaerolineae bacterium]
MGTTTSRFCPSGVGAIVATVLVGLGLGSIGTSTGVAFGVAADARGAVGIGPWKSSGINTLLASAPGVSVSSVCELANVSLATEIFVAASGDAVRHKGGGSITALGVAAAVGLTATVGEIVDSPVPTVLTQALTDVSRNKPSQEPKSSKRP